VVQHNATVLNKKIEKARAVGKTETDIVKIKSDFEVREKIRVAKEEGKQEDIENLALQLNVEPKRKPDTARIERLAKPKDKWKVGKQLLKLYKDYPHDRVLERMIKQEFATNQAFRYPAEYDTFRKDADIKLKIFKTE
jgi:hypothetical protein